MLEPGEREGVLRTFNANGTMHESRMIILDDGDVIALSGAVLYSYGYGSPVV